MSTLMRQPLPSFLCRILLSAGAALVLSASSGARDAMPSALAVSVAQLPTPLPVGRHDILVYEILLWNVSPSSVDLKAVDVFGTVDNQHLASFSTAELERRLWHPSGASTLTIAAGERVVIYVELATSDTRAGGLRHHLAYRINPANGTGRDEAIDALVRINHASLPVLGPPLRGGPWVAVYDPALTRGHRRVYYTIDGVPRLPGRFAIDWMRPIGGAGGDDGEGQDVLAVADGTVVSLRDGVPEPAKGAPRLSVPITEAAGNFIALAIGGDRIAFYEHLQPGLLVAEGARVKRGQVLGHLGATGQAAGPHLHFHLANNVSPLGAEGQPYRLAGAVTIGRYSSIDAFAAGGKWDAPTPADAIAGANFPASNVVVRFMASAANRRPKVSGRRRSSVW